MIARARLVGVEHAQGCADEARPLLLQRSSSQWDGTIERTTATHRCRDCGLEVKVTSSRETRRRAG